MSIDVWWVYPLNALTEKLLFIPKATCWIPLMMMGQFVGNINFINDRLFKYIILNLNECIYRVA